MATFIYLRTGVHCVRVIYDRLADRRFQFLFTCTVYSVIMLVVSLTDMAFNAGHRFIEASLEG